MTYDSIDRVGTVKDGRGNTATYVYDGEDRVTEVEYSDGSSFSFKFDANGNTTERVDAKSFGEPYTGVTYSEYDKLNRPTLKTTPTAKTTRYGYDYDGNLTSLEDAGKAVTYGYGSDDVLTSLTEPENASHPFKMRLRSGRRQPRIDDLSQWVAPVHQDEPRRASDEAPGLQTDWRTELLQQHLAELDA